MASISHEIVLNVSKTYKTNFEFVAENFPFKTVKKTFSFDIPGLATW
jgi:hypothetical protein